MIGYLTGKIISKKPTQILMDVNGVGYLINISVNTFNKLPAEAETVSLFTYLSVKEDSLTLFGFDSPSEKEMFELLIAVNGVGPKSALGILSGIEFNELRDAIKTGNLGRITAVPGIGRKTGERLLIELRDKVDSVAEEFVTGIIPKANIKNDAVMALLSLGYNQKTAEKTVSNILAAQPDLTIEGLIKFALAYLNK